MTAAPRLVVRPAHLLLALLLAAVLVPVLIALVADRLGWGMTAAGAGRMLWSSVVLLGVAAVIAWCSRGWLLDLGLP
ncbi:MAG TPA: hypothetical protein VLA19_07125, partial [Herpetosiphonaceae bacterium]|nr:hypothetical protein [Herpetosiphonaceae bacterium]